MSVDPTWLSSLVSLLVFLPPPSLLNHTGVSTIVEKLSVEKLVT